MAIKCKLKTNIYANNLSAAGVNSFEAIGTSIKNKADILERLKDPSFTYGLNNRKDQQQQSIDLANALEQIDELEEYGLIVSKSSNPVSNETAQFVSRLLTNEFETLGFLNRLDKDGKYRVTSGNNSISINEDGTASSTLSAKELNDILHKYFSAQDSKYPRTRYIIQEKGTIAISKQLAKDFNNKMYAEYVAKMGNMNRVAVSNLSMTEQDREAFIPVEEEALNMRTAPIKNHIRKTLNANESSIREIRRKNPIDARERIKQIQDRNEDMLRIQENLESQASVDDVIMYFDSIIKYGTDNMLNDFGGLTVASRSRMTEGLKTVVKATEWGKQNPIFSIKEMQGLTEVNLSDLESLSSSAKRILFALESSEFDDTKEFVENTLGTELEDETALQEVRNMSSGLRQLAQNVLGIRHIDNPIIQTIEFSVRKANTAAHNLAKKINRKLTKYYEAAKKAGLDVKTFYQRNADGNVSGYMTDRFSYKWWSNPRQYTMSTRGKINTRINNTEMLDPYILFEQAEDSKERVDYVNRLKSDLGDYAFSIYYDQAKEKWDNYLNDKAITENQTPDKLQSWEDVFDPKKRINNINRKVYNTTKGKTNVIKGSDRYLQIIPRRLTPSGVETGLFDPNFDAIEANPEVLKFYSAVRETFYKNNIALGNISSKLAPPSFGYIPKTFKEKLNEQGIAALREGAWEAISEPITSKKYPTNNVTGEAEASVELRLHTIADEINARMQESLRTNQRYQELLEAGDRRSKALAAQIRADVKGQVSAVVESEMSGNFLDSITLANFETIKQAKRTEIELEIKTAASLFYQDGVIKYRGGTDTNDPMNSAKLLVQKSLTHFLNREFYDIQDQDDPTFIGSKAQAERQRLSKPGEKVGDVKRGITLGKVISPLRSAARYLYLAYSAMAGKDNALQGLVNNYIKAMQSGTFSADSLTRAYGAIGSTRNRKLLDNLHILGDVAYQGNKGSADTAESSSILSKLRKPFYIQTAVEKFNQGTVALAVFMDTKIKDAQGNESTIYDEIDDEWNLNSKWSAVDGKHQGTGNDLVVDVTERTIVPINFKTHGDYKSPLLLERSEVGKLTTLFRRWLPEMVYERFGEERTDYMTNEQVMGHYVGLVRTLKKQLTGGKATQAEIRGTANALKDLVVLISLRIAAGLLSSGLCDTPECKEQGPMNLFLLNTLSKVTTDVNTVINPVDLWSNMSRPFTSDGVLNDFGKFAKSMFTMEQYTRSVDDLYDKGDYKFMNYGKKLIPVYRPNVYKYKMLTSKLFYNEYNLFAEKDK